MRGLRGYAKFMCVCQNGCVCVATKFINVKTQTDAPTVCVHQATKQIQSKHRKQLHSKQQNKRAAPLQQWKKRSMFHWRSWKRAATPPKGVLAVRLQCKDVRLLYLRTAGNDYRCVSFACCCVAPVSPALPGWSTRRNVAFSVLSTLLQNSPTALLVYGFQRGRN